MSSFYRVLTQKSVDIQDNTLLQDIESHLAGLLNARQWMLSTREEYGLPDICIETSEKYASRLLEATRDLIEHFEPRLTIRSMTCDEKKRFHTQLAITVVASMENSSTVALNATLGGQGLNRVNLA